MEACNDDNDDDNDDYSMLSSQPRTVLRTVRRGLHWEIDLPRVVRRPVPTSWSRSTPRL